MHRIFLLVLVAACTATEVDDAIDAEEGKADSISRHYLLWAASSQHPGTLGYYARAGGGELRCPDGEIRERCELSAEDLELSSRFSATTSAQVIDELEDHSIIARGRIVQSGDRIYLYATALTRGITSVVPTTPCYRIQPLSTAGNCPVGSEPFCYQNEFTQLDTSDVTLVEHIYLDGADPTPDFWDQATPAVQAKIDAGLLLARSRPVYTCGEIEERAADDHWFWGSQLFVPST